MFPADCLAGPLPGPASTVTGETVAAQLLKTLPTLVTPPVPPGPPLVTGQASTGELFSLTFDGGRVTPPRHITGTGVTCALNLRSHHPVLIDAGFADLEGPNPLVGRPHPALPVPATVITRPGKPQLNYLTGN